MTYYVDVQKLFRYGQEVKIILTVRHAAFIEHVANNPGLSCLRAAEFVRPDLPYAYACTNVTRMMRPLINAGLIDKRVDNDAAFWNGDQKTFHNLTDKCWSMMYEY